MPTNSNLKNEIEDEFSSQLGSIGFRQIGSGKWIRSQNEPIKNFFVLNSMKGGQLSPAWGFSSGITPSFKNGVFRKQSTDKNSVMDLIIDPIDATGNVPSFAFCLLPGSKFDIRSRAEQSVKLAASDFVRVNSLRDFCSFFLERKQLKYRRFLFDMYNSQRLAYGFVLILNGQKDDGLKQIQNFCEKFDADFNNSILQEYIQSAESISLKKQLN
jgi:hypothetical protein